SPSELTSKKFWRPPGRQIFFSPSALCEKLLPDDSPQAKPGAQELLRINRLAIDAGLVVQVRAGRSAGRADPADDLAGAHRLAFFDVSRREVRVACRQPVAMVDLDHPAIAAVPADRRDGPAGGGTHRVAMGAAQIKPGVHR